MAGPRVRTVQDCLIRWSNHRYGRRYLRAARRPIPGPPLEPEERADRVPSGAVIVFAIYHRNWRLLWAAIVWTAVDPLLFSPPETEDAWMTRAVLAERWWIREGTNRTVGLGSPNVCNTAGALGFVYALYAAWRGSPKGATIGVVASVGPKLWWLRVLVERYDRRTGDGASDCSMQTPFSVVSAPPASTVVSLNEVSERGPSTRGHGRPHRDHFRPRMRSAHS